jgi:group I intron endonuclease
VDVAGIYRLDFGNKYYYGSTLRLETRRRQHLRGLEASTHRNHRVQAAYNAHGPFEFRVVELCEVWELRRLEQLYLDIHYGYPTCLNLSPSAETTRGRVMSEAQKQKLRDLWTGKKKPPRSAEHIRNNAVARMKQVTVTDLEGNKTVYAGQKIAAEILGVDKRVFNAWVMGKAKPTKQSPYRGWTFTT